MVFRYHGDDFILIFQKHEHITSEEIFSYEVFRDTPISVEVSHHDLKDGIPSI
jgi:hypothetical protein